MRCIIVRCLIRSSRVLPRYSIFFLVLAGFEQRRGPSKYVSGDDGQTILYAFIDERKKARTVFQIGREEE
jgi:hypothetical protein